MKKIFTTFALLMFVLSLNAQVTFEKEYNIYNSAISRLVLSQQDGYLMVMTSNTDKYYMTLVKTDLYGDTLWTKNHDLGIKYLGDLVGTSDEESNIYIAIHGNNQNVFKFDSNGNLIWAKYYTSSNKKMIVKDNILWVCSEAYHGNYLYKINANTGDSLWRSPIFNDADWHHQCTCTSMAITEGNEIIVTANFQYNYQIYPSRFFKLMPNGTQLVDFTIDTSKELYVADTRCVGNEVISIASLDFTGNNKTTCFLRYTLDGSILAYKEQIFDCQAVNLRKMALTNDNRVVTMGYFIENNYTDGHLIMHCYSMGGDSLWTTFNGKWSYEASDIKLATDGGYIITGSSETDLIPYHPFLIKTNNLGVLTSMPEKTNTLQVVAYPNPTTDAVMFTMPGLNEGKLSIYNSTGQLCFETMIKSEKTVWNTDGYKAGLYFYNIRTATETSCGSVVLK